VNENEAWFHKGRRGRVNQTQTLGSKNNHKSTFLQTGCVSCAVG
jgi:hypothetical protein